MLDELIAHEACSMPNSIFVLVVEQHRMVSAPGVIQEKQEVWKTKTKDKAMIGSWGVRSI